MVRFVQRCRPRHLHTLLTNAFDRLELEDGDQVFEWDELRAMLETSLQSKPAKLWIISKMLDMVKINNYKQARNEGDFLDVICSQVDKQIEICSAAKQSIEEEFKTKVTQIKEKQAMLVHKQVVLERKRDVDMTQSVHRSVIYKEFFTNTQAITNTYFALDRAIEAEKDLLKKKLKLYKRTTHDLITSILKSKSSIQVLRRKPTSIS